MHEALTVFSLFACVPRFHTTHATFLKAAFTQFGNICGLPLQMSELAEEMGLSGSAVEYMKLVAGRSRLVVGVLVQ